MTIRVGNFTEIEPELDTDYDYCLLIGVFEYGQSYIGGETPYEDFLRIIRKHTAVNGRIVIAIENKYGLKYFAGCKEDHLGSYFKGLEGYVPQDGVKTFSKNGLNRLFKSCNEKNVRFFYPYPDYKFMTSLYSDERLPLKGELYNNDRNFDRDRIKLFDEKKTFDGILEDGYFDIYSNSYLVILGDDVQTEYVRYSNDRADEYKICTEILNIHGEKIVKKRALSEAGIDHIRRMRDNCDLLTDAYKDIERRAAETLTDLLPEDSGLKDEYKELLAPLKDTEEAKLIHKLVKAADKIAAYVKCLREESSGNREFMAAKESIGKIIAGYDLEEVKIFMDRFVPPYGYTLDKLTGKDD